MTKRRRFENKTDYKARTEMLKGEKPRIIFRKTNKYIIGQFVTSKAAQDSVSIGLTSKDLLEYGWPKTALGSLKSLTAAYLLGFLLGKKVSDKEGKVECILDIGLTRNHQKSRIYAFLKGIVDSGVKISHNPKVFPEESRIKGAHLKQKLDFDNIKSTIDKK